MNRALLQEGIRNAEGEITIAANIVDGVNILKIKNFDAILLDWNLGDQSGVRILEYLSSIPKEKQPAVFVLSSESSGKINLQVKPNSVAAVMERPVAISEVIKTIDQNLNGYSSQAHTFRSFRGSNLFDISMYDELISSGTQCKQILSLLTDFEYSIEKHIQLIKKAIRERDLSNSAKQFHSIKSICFASGTYTMGEYFDYSAVRMFSNSNSASMIDLSRFIDPGIRIWDITRAHINIYKLSLTEM